jgi:hypothetical protein
VSTQIPTAFINQFRANFDMLVQQMDSRLLNAVEQDTLTGEFGFRDQLGAVLPQARTSRHADTPFTEIPHSRRRYQTQEWELGEMIDRQDTERMLTNPQSAYVQAFAASFARQRDKTILDAFFTDAATGKAGATTVSLPAGQQIAVDFVESGSATNSSLTLGKLRRAVELLGDVGAEDGDMYIAVTQRELTAMRRTLEYNSADYVDFRALQNWRPGMPLPMFMGLNWIVLPNRVVAPDGTTLLTMFNLDASSHRRIPVWSKKGMLFAQTAGTEINAAPDPTKSFNTRLHGRASFGATRLEEVRVVEVKCSTSVF